MVQTIHILMVEDTAADTELIEHELRAAGIGFISQRVDTKDGFARALAEFAPDIILSDYNLPQFTGLEALKLAKENQQYTPFLLITGSLNEEKVVRFMKEGVDDYILKSSLKRLPSAVLNALEKRRAESDHAKAEAELRESEERFRLVARATNDVIWDWNIVDNTVWWNEGVRTLFGYPNEEARVEPTWWRERLHPEDSDRIAAGINAFIEGDASFWSDEYHYQRADGSYALVIDRAFIVRDQNGHAVRMIGSMMDITERRRAEETINYLAYYDALTGLPNRTLFDNRLSQALALAERNQQAIAVVLLDLDRFKSINDTLGHSVGDLLLRSVGERLSNCVRGGDTVARFSGDGFALLLTQIGRHQDVIGIANRLERNVLDLANQILEALEKPFNLEEHELYVTASIGIGLCPDDGTDARSLLKNAGAALHSVKDAGGNNFQSYTASMNARSVERLTLESALRRGLDRNEFVLHYQPQVEINSGRIIAVEALIRWRSPELGIVSPADFIPLAESNGLIVPIGEWTLQEACAANKSWQEQGLPPIRMSVNLSPRQFDQPNLIETVTGVLRETGLDPTFLEFELTEGSIMKNAERAIVTLSKLKAMGIQIAIDDFGSGYSSLSYLKRFPIDRLKIDQSFVREATNNPTDAAIIMAIITLAQNLRLKVIAEGVETEEQSRFLHLLRCDEIQGYLFSRPLPEDELKRLLGQYESHILSNHLIATPNVFVHA